MQTTNVTSHIATENGRNLEAYLMEADSSTPLIAMFHGTGSSRNGEITRRLQRIVSPEVGTLRFDSPVDVDEEGKVTRIATPMINAATAVLDYLAEHHSDRQIGIYGNSGGAFAAIQALGKGIETGQYDPDLINAMALLAPFADFQVIMKKILKNEGKNVGQWEQEGIFNYALNGNGPVPVSFSAYEDAAGIDASVNAGLITCPTFAIIGSDDPIVPREQGFALYDSLGGHENRVVALEGYGHNATPEKVENTLELATSWFMDRLQPDRESAVPRQHALQG